MASAHQPWPERPAAKRREREKWPSAGGRALVSVDVAICGAVARARRSQERENGCTSVETTGHLPERPLNLFGVEVDLDRGDLAVEQLEHLGELDRILAYVRFGSLAASGYPIFWPAANGRKAVT